MDSRSKIVNNNLAQNKEKTKMKKKIISLLVIVSLMMTAMFALTACDDAEMERWNRSRTHFMDSADWASQTMQTPTNRGATHSFMFTAHGGDIEIIAILFTFTSDATSYANDLRSVPAVTQNNWQVHNSGRVVLFTSNEASMNYVRNVFNDVTPNPMPPANGGGGTTLPRLAAPTNVEFSAGAVGRHYVSWTSATPAPPIVQTGGVRYRIYANGVFLANSTLTTYNIGSTIFEGTDPIVFTVVGTPGVNTNFQNSLPSEPATLTRTALSAPTNVRTVATSLTWTNPDTPALGNWPTRIYANGEYVLTHTGAIIAISALGLAAGEHQITVRLAARGAHLQSPLSVAYTLTIAE